MENTIIIERDAIRQEVDLRNHYMGEAIKRNDINADLMESNNEDNELFTMFLNRACNELISGVTLRFPSISYICDRDFVTISFTSHDNRRHNLLPVLRRAITDYLVNELILQWLLLRRPDMAQSYISLRNALFENVQQNFAKFYNTEKIRRRATNLAGI